MTRTPRQEDAGYKLYEEKEQKSHTGRTLIESDERKGKSKAEEVLKTGK